MLLRLLLLWDVPSHRMRIQPLRAACSRSPNLLRYNTAVMAYAVMQFVQDRLRLPCSVTSGPVKRSVTCVSTASRLAVLEKLTTLSIWHYTLPPMSHPGRQGPGLSLTEASLRIIFSWSSSQLLYHCHASLHSAFRRSSSQTIRGVYTERSEYAQSDTIWLLTRCLLGRACPHLIRL